MKKDKQHQDLFYIWQHVSAKCYNHCRLPRDPSPRVGLFMTHTPGNGAQDDIFVLKSIIRNPDLFIPYPLTFQLLTCRHFFPLFLGISRMVIYRFMSLPRLIFSVSVLYPLAVILSFLWPLPTLASRNVPVLSDLVF